MERYGLLLCTCQRCVQYTGINPNIMGISIRTKAHFQMVISEQTHDIHCAVSYLVLYCRISIVRHCHRLDHLQPCSKQEVPQEGRSSASTSVTTPAPASTAREGRGGVHTTQRPESMIGTGGI